VFVVNHGSYDAIKFYTIRDGSLSVLDALTGTVLRTVPLPGNAGPAVVDERRGRAFVVTHRRRPVGAADPWGWIPSRLRPLGDVPPPSSDRGGRGARAPDTARARAGHGIGPIARDEHVPGRGIHSHAVRRLPVSDGAHDTPVDVSTT